MNLKNIKKRLAKLKRFANLESCREYAEIGANQLFDAVNIAFSAGLINREKWRNYTTPIVQFMYANKIRRFKFIKEGDELTEDLSCRI